MKKYLLLFITVLLATFSFGQIKLDKLKEKVKGLAAPSTEEVAEGLKEALSNGASKGSDIVSKLDGYYKNSEIKIPFPPEVAKVETRLRQVGMGAEVDKFIEALNRGAEEAAKEAERHARTELARLAAAGCPAFIISLDGNLDWKDYSFTLQVHA